MTKQEAMARAAEALKKAEGSSVEFGKLLVGIAEKWLTYAHMLHEHEKDN